MYPPLPLRARCAVRIGRMAWNSRLIYGPWNPQAGHLYVRPKRRHFSQRQMVTAPQLGQFILTAFSSGLTFLPQEMHVDIAYQPMYRLAGYLKVD